MRNLQWKRVWLPYIIRNYSYSVADNYKITNDNLANLLYKNISLQKHFFIIFSKIAVEYGVASMQVP